MKKVIAFFLSMFSLGLLYLVYQVSNLFCPIKIIEPAEYGIFISDIKNQSDEDVIFINLFESKFWVIKPQKTTTVDSWLAASDYKKLKRFSSDFVGSVMEKSGRSMVIITKKGLFYLNLGRYHSWKTGEDAKAHIWVLHE